MDAVEAEPELPAPPPVDTVSRAPRALALGFLNGLANRLGTLGIGIALARVVGPDQFGTYAVALLALTAALSFNELGVSLAIVRWRDAPETIAPTVNAISLLASILIAAVGFALAPAFAAAMGQPDAAPIVRVMVISIIISGTVAAPAALLQREFLQERRMVIDQVNTWSGAIVSLGLAIAGTGAMSLAVGRIVGSTLAMVLFLKFSPLPFSLKIDRQVAGRLLRFGLPLAGASIVVFVIGFADQIVAGRVLGSTALGFYLLAFNLSSWPVQMFSQPLRAVAPPTFSRLQHHPEAMRRTFGSIVGLLGAVTFPICLLLAGAAEPLIRFVYGDGWSPAASALVWLGVMAAFRILFELAYDYLVVVGVSRSIFTLQVVTLIALIPTMIAGAHLWGTAGIAAAQVVVAAVVALPLYLVLFHRAGLPVGRVLARLVLPVAAAAAVGASALALATALPSDVIAILLGGVVTLLVLGSLVYRDRATLSQLRGSALAGTAAEQVGA
jgi:O-antigen/teichoic acid export membrane protein